MIFVEKLITSWFFFKLYYVDSNFIHLTKFLERQIKDSESIVTGHMIFAHQNFLT